MEFLDYFNSIKVRLEQMEQDGTLERYEFQFHKGTIRTKQDYKDQIEKHLFQFHKGTIRTQSLPAVALSPSLFQFHKGTIRTFFAFCLPPERIISIP